MPQPPTSKRTTKKPRNREPQKARPQAWWQRPGVVASGASIVVVVTLVFLLVGGAHSSSPSAQTACTATSLPAVSSGPTGGQTLGVAPSAVASPVEHPPTSIWTAVGTGGQSGSLNRVCATTSLTGPGGKPAVVYVGAEFCPYCAAERWSIAMAMARFGTFANLQLMQSSSADIYPNTNTFTFYNATYTSNTIDFQPVELEDQNRQPFQSPSAELNSVFSAIDQEPYTSTTGGFPFLDIGGRFVLSQTSYSPQLLQGMTWQQIATALENPSNPITQAIVGNANYITAAVCISTNNAPADVCSSSTIQGIERTLNGQGLIG